APAHPAHPRALHRPALRRRAQPGRRGPAAAPRARVAPGMRLLLLLMFAASAHAQDYGQRPEVREFIDSLVAKHGFVKSELQQLFTRVQPNEQVLNLIRTPAERLEWPDYRAQLVT